MIQKPTSKRDNVFRITDNLIIEALPVPNKHLEKVLAVPVGAFGEVSLGFNFSRDHNGAVGFVSSTEFFAYIENHICVVPCWLCNARYGMRQLATYDYITRGPSKDPRDPAKEYFVYQRTKQAGEQQRLAGQLSIGVGGHPEIQDIVWGATNWPAWLFDTTCHEFDLRRAISAARGREINEELRFKKKKNFDSSGVLDDMTDCGNTSLNEYYITLRCCKAADSSIGVIVDDANAVGRAHVGISYELYIKAGLFDVIESREPDLTVIGFMTLDQLLARREEFENWSQLLIDSFASAAAQ